MKRKTFNLWKRRLTIVFSVFLAGGFLYVYGWTNLFSITTFVLEGVEEKNVPSITAKLFEATQHNTFYILPGDKILTLNFHRVKQVITKELPNTASINISFGGLHTVRVVVTPHMPMFKTGEGKAYDKDGIVYEEQNDISHLPVISFTSSTTPTRVFFENLSYFIPQLTTLLFPVGHIVVDEYNDVYLYASGSLSRVLITKDADVKKTWLSLVSAVDTEPLKTSLEKKKGSLEYIDLRFGNKVFYKFTNDVKPAIIAPHATTTATTTLQ